jgi:hypothetical protein
MKIDTAVVLVAGAKLSLMLSTSLVGLFSSLSRNFYARKIIKCSRKCNSLGSKNA